METNSFCQIKNPSFLHILIFQVYWDKCSSLCYLEEVVELLTISNFKKEKSKALLNESWENCWLYDILPMHTWESILNITRKYNTIYLHNRPKSKIIAINPLKLYSSYWKIVLMTNSIYSPLLLLASSLFSILTHVYPSLPPTVIIGQTPPSIIMTIFHWVEIIEKQPRWIVVVGTCSLHRWPSCEGYRSSLNSLIVFLDFLQNHNSWTNHVQNH